jgi:signal peptidase II
MTFQLRMKNKYYLVTLVVLLIDHLTKFLVTRQLVGMGTIPHRTVEIVPDYLRISYIQNSGVAFGFFQNIESLWKPYILAGMAVVAVLVILVYSSRMPLNRTLLQVALTLTMGGILGNFMDRLVHGYVVDFIEFHVKESFYWPTFNLADSAITVGIALLLIDTVKNPEAEEELSTPLAGGK